MLYYSHSTLKLIIKKYRKMKAKLFLVLLFISIIAVIGSFIEAIASKNGVSAIFIFIALYIIVQIIKPLFKGLAKEIKDYQDEDSQL